MLLRMIGQIKVSGDRFRYVFVVFLYVRREGVLGICRLVVSLFRRCIMFCKECITCTLCKKSAASPYIKEALKAVKL